MTQNFELPITPLGGLTTRKKGISPMHIIECFIEASGFDDNLVRGGISNYIWNLAKEFVEKGHKVSVVSAANGQMEYLQAHYPIVKLDYTYQYQLPLALDQQIWQNFPATVHMDLVTTAYKLTHHGVDYYYLSNNMLDQFPEACFPPYESKGQDLRFFKPIIYQIDAIHFIKTQLADSGIVHCHEPYYEYLFPLAFKNDPLKKVVSTVQSNMPINKKIYRPKLQGLLAFLESEKITTSSIVDLNKYQDHLEEQDPFVKKMRAELPKTHLNYNYPDQDYVNFYSLILEHSDLVDFLSAGHLNFYSHFKDTPFEDFFKKLAISQFVKQFSSKCFVGWCGIGHEWFVDANIKAARRLRSQTLAQCGLGDPELPTYYHNARYALNHKGQLELLRAIDGFLTQNGRANFIIRCLSGTGIPHPYFHEVHQKWKSFVHLESQNVSTQTLMNYIGASDFCIFPSKFEMDTFLIAQGEAMIAGLVPLASDQLGMAHWQHGDSLPQNENSESSGSSEKSENSENSENSEKISKISGKTGWALPRSFQEDDPQLTNAIIQALFESSAIFKTETYQTLSHRARQVAQIYTWAHSAKAHLDAFSKMNTFNFLTDETHPNNKLLRKEISCHEGQGFIWSGRLFDQKLFEQINTLKVDFVDFAIVPPGSSIGLHQHKQNQEEYFVIKGEGQISLNGSSFRVKTGDRILNPEFGTHGLINTGQEDLWLIVIECSKSECTNMDLSKGGQP